jgi:nitroreductase
MKDAIELLRERHAVRFFDGQPVERDLLARVTEAGALAPSAMNSQPWRFDVCTGETLGRVAEVMLLTTAYLDDYLDALGTAGYERAKRFYEGLGNAPVAIAVSLPTAWRDDLMELNGKLSAGCAIENMLLEAVSLGLAACNVTFSFWVRDELGYVLGLDKSRTVVSLIVVGYAAEEPAAPPHRMDIVRWLG